MTDDKNVQVVIAAGGTAGHVVPALAVADALRDKGAAVSFIGAGRMEAELVPEAGYPISHLSVRGISRRSLRQATEAIYRAFVGVLKAISLLRHARPRVVLGGGGYVAGVVGFAALLQRIPLVLTEADSHLGLSNRLLGPFAKRVCLSFPINGKTPPRYVVTGRPVRSTYRDREAARREFGLSADRPTLLIFGGSLGARSINNAAPAAFSDDTYQVLHFTGERDAAAVISPGSHYIVRTFSSDFGKALAVADLAVARSGGSIFELAQYGLPAILIPYPEATGGHQLGNAEWMQGAGGAEILLDDELSPQRLRSLVDEIFTDQERFERMRSSSQALGRHDAAAEIAEIVLAVAG